MEENQCTTKSRSKDTQRQSHLSFNNPQNASSTSYNQICSLAEDFSIPGILRIKKPLQKTSEDTTSKAHSITVPYLSPSDPRWFATIYEKDITFAKTLPSLHVQIYQIIQDKSFAKDKWDTFNHLRIQIEDIYTQLLCTRIKFCREQNVDTYFWKILYYNVIEFFKTTLTNSNISKHRHLEIQFFELIAHGIVFYNNLVSILEDKFLKKETNPLHEERFKKYESIAKVSAQKILINLGNLCRYREKIRKSGDFSEAKFYYEKAQGLIPSNGIPYNQLAILAIYSRKKFDAIYYHMRSLMSSNPIQSAKESLKDLFDELRKKYEETYVETKPQSPPSPQDFQHNMRKEVWIYPDGARRLHRTDICDNTDGAFDKHLFELSSEELLRRFISTYLYLIGKFFSGIGFESYSNNLDNLISMFKLILHRDPLSITKNRFFKILALNIFVVEHNNKSESRKEIRTRALNMVSLLLAFILNKVNCELKKTNLNDNNGKFDEVSRDLNTLLQYTKISCDWLSTNPKLWSDIEPSTKLKISLRAEFSQYIRFFPNAFDSSVQNLNFFGYQTVKLDEDDFISGFIPLAAIKYSVNPEINQTRLRLETIFNFGNSYTAANAEEKIENLENIPTFEKIDEKSNSVTTVTSVDLHHSKLKGLLAENSDQERSQLSKLKRELEQKSKIKQMYQDKLQEILQDVNTKVYIEVRPKYLVTDTNCFIDSLEDLEILAKQFNRYYLIVPLIVVKELDGLAKGFKIESRPNSNTKNNLIHHFDEVSSLAKKSLQFIRSCSHVKCATTKGSILNSSLFALEEEENLSNDDKILATALSLQKESNIECTRDGKSFIQTELILITTDRNLRVKAHSRNLIVSELKEFLNWASNEETHQ